MKGKLKKLDKDKLPVYEIIIDENDNTGISLISLVEEPAIVMKGMLFSEEKTMMSFKEIDDEKQQIVGPALIPNMKIYREDEKYGQYYVVFTKETIEKMVEKFNKYGSNRRINIDHSNQMVDGFIMEDWIVEDPVYDKSRKYGFEVPVGTYMIKVKIEDKDFWQSEVKENGKFGFSIEGLLGQQLVSLSKQEDEVSVDDLTEEDLLEIFELKTWRNTADSSNVDKMKYNDETKELVIKFNDGSYYTYFDIDFEQFMAVVEGDGTCVTEGENQYGTWEIGKNPSVGAAVWEWLINAIPEPRYERGGSLR
jgi:hypothetical protein